eukprot:3124573-Pleurochrysis_carterae.AAC.1
MRTDSMRRHLYRCGRHKSEIATNQSYYRPGELEPTKSYKYNPSGLGANAGSRAGARLRGGSGSGGALRL